MKACAICAVLWLCCRTHLNTSTEMWIRAEGWISVYASYTFVGHITVNRMSTKLLSSWTLVLPAGLPWGFDIWRKSDSASRILFAPQRNYHWDCSWVCKKDGRAPRQEMKALVEQDLELDKYPGRFAFIVLCFTWMATLFLPISLFFFCLLRRLMQIPVFPLTLKKKNHIWNQ